MRSWLVEGAHRHAWYEWSQLNYKKYESKVHLHWNVRNKKLYFERIIQVFSWIKNSNAKRSNPFFLLLFSRSNEFMQKRIKILRLFWKSFAWLSSTYSTPSSFDSFISIKIQQFPFLQMKSTIFMCVYVNMKNFTKRDFTSILNFWNQSTKHCLNGLSLHTEWLS